MDLMIRSLQASGSQGNKMKALVLLSPEQFREGQPQRNPSSDSKCFLTPHLSSKQRVLEPSSPETQVCLTSHLSPSPSSSETSGAWGSWGAKGLPTLGPMTSISLPLSKHSVSSRPPFSLGPAQGLLLAWKK